MAASTIARLRRTRSASSASETAASPRATARTSSSESVLPVIVTATSNSLAHVPAQLSVVGSVNLDLVARAERLPRPGETVTGAAFSEVPGGKGANQAVAAARLGAEVTFFACVGKDGFADLALAELRSVDVDLAHLQL